MMHSMFHLPLPVMEKILRPVIVYLFLIGFLRLFGKRELAQLNPFDLVVLLSLSNTVQNAIIGDDNSVSGGIIGAFALLAINWLLMWLLYRSPKLNQKLEGSKTVLIQAGVVSEEAMKKETLTFEELISVLNKNGFNNPADVEECVLEPNGTFFVKGKTPTSETVHSRELLNAVERLTAEVMAMRAEMQARG
ncbi:YetF domain-containing protein [Granulicella mallensis]